VHDEQQHEITVNGFVDDDARVRSAGDVMNAIGVEFAGSDSFHSNHSTVFLPRPQRSHHYLYKVIVITMSMDSGAGTNLKVEGGTGPGRKWGTPIRRKAPPLF